MDAIALLCTLHAEGPTTLERLRAHGCGTLADLRALEPEALAGLLDSTPAGARRFLREAAGLAERLGETAEAPGLVTLAASAPGATRSAPQVAAPDVRGSEPDEPALEGVGLSRRERGLIDRVLDRWRSTDGEPPAPLPRPEPPGPQRDGPRRDGPRREVPPAAAAAPAAPTREAPTALAPGALEGLDGATCDLLGARGVTSFAELAGLDDGALLGLAGGGLPFTRGSRLRYLARRELADAPAPARRAPAEPAPATPATPAGPATTPTPPTPPTRSTTPTAPTPATAPTARFSAREAADVAPAETPALAAYELHPFRPSGPAAPADRDPEADDPAGPFA